MEDWKSFKHRGKTYSELLRNEKPDIVARLNNEVRERKERERKEKEAENIGEKKDNGIIMGNLVSITGQVRMNQNMVIHLLRNHQLKKKRSYSGKQKEENLNGLKR